MDNEEHRPDWEQHMSDKNGIEYLKKVCTGVFLAFEEDVADDISKAIFRAINTIGELESQLSEAHSVNRIAALHVTEVEAEIKRLKTLLASDVHSCHDLCKRPMCRLRRELREAAELHAVQAKTIRDMEELMDDAINRFYNHKGDHVYDAMVAYRGEEL